MASTVPARTPLGAATNNRKWYLDVFDPAAPSIPVGVFGIQELKVNPGTAGLQDDSDFDGNGFKSQIATTQEWSIEGKVVRKTTLADSTAYDPGQEVLRKAGRGIGLANVVKVRVYEMTPDGPRVEAYEGTVAVGWTDDGGSMEPISTVSFTLTGRGYLAEIAHPEDVVAVPVIASALPSGAAAGASVVIEGAHFTGVTGPTGVKFGATNATSYTVLTDGSILAVVPAGSAGSAPITVGASDPFAYTRGA